MDQVTDTAQQGASQLLTYGPLGIIAVAFFILVGLVIYWQQKTIERHRKASEVAQGKLLEQSTKFSAALDNQADALEKLADSIRSK